MPTTTTGNHPIRRLRTDEFDAVTGGSLLEIDFGFVRVYIADGKYPTVCSGSGQNTQCTVK